MEAVDEAKRMRLESRIVSPTTLSRIYGEVVPMPMLPEESRRINSVYVERLSFSEPKAREPRVDEAYMCFKLTPPEVSVKTNCGAVPALASWRRLLGVEVPTPIVGVVTPPLISNRFSKFINLIIPSF